MSDVPPTAEKDAPHWPECWCNGTGRRPELGAGVRCNLPQLTASEREYLTRVIPPGVDQSR